MTRSAINPYSMLRIAPAPDEPMAQFAAVRAEMAEIARFKLRLARRHQGRDKMKSIFNWLFPMKRQPSWFKGFPPLNPKLLRLHVACATHVGMLGR